MTTTFETWLATRPKWLQTAASDLLKRQSLPDDAETNRLADLCIDEADGVTEGFSTVEAGVFDIAKAGPQIRISQIHSIQGVNALDKSAKLDFGDADLVVVYGGNGTGKSGFARLIKHAAGARTGSDLLSDVYAADPPAARASFVIERDGKSTIEKWTLAAGALGALRHVHVFDVDVALRYMTEKAEASYEPRRLRFLSSLAAICVRVRASLEDRRTLLPSAMPTVPQELRHTDLATYVSGLEPSLKPDVVTKKLTPSPGHADRVKTLFEALGATNPETRLVEIKTRLEALAATGITVERIAKGLSDEKIAELTTAKARATAARAAASAAATLTFDEVDFPGVGEATWRAMWEAARSYSTQKAYPGYSFPHVDEGSKCPLCQQLLDNSATKRLASFESFVKGEVEKKAKAAETTHGVSLKALPVLPSQADWLAHFASIPDAEEGARTAWAAAVARRTDVAEAATPDVVPALDLGPLLRLVRRQVTALQAERDLLKKAQEASERANMRAELDELRMLAWCNENRAAILAELARLKKTATLRAAINKTGTAALTTKKKELAREELTSGYQARFETELRALGGARIRVKPVVVKTDRTKFEFALALVDAKEGATPARVLSEGETRVVALAVFLADVTVAGARTPFIFDDPISSLDQDFEERVVRRLLDLARTRQVLVFTHRLSLLSLLRDACDKAQGIAKITDGGTSVSVRQLALRRMGGKVGLATLTNERENAVHQAADNIIRKRLPVAQGHYDNGSVAAYDSTMKAICRDLRILTERAVEEVLLNKVVMRFRRSVTTMNRLPHLAKISTEDCTFLDDLMTRLSVFEHSQSEEMPARVPDIAEVREDAERLRKWAGEFKKRKVPSSTNPAPPTP